MRKNIILKSTFRQFWRSIFLALLVGVAAFFLVSRVMEYDIVVNEIERIGLHYRSIGYFTSTRGEQGISEAADFVRELESPYIAFEDFNQSGFATLHNMYNTLTAVNQHSVARSETLRIYDREVFFYGELVDVFGQFLHFAPRTRLRFRVDTVVVGYPEWIMPGREIEVDWRAEDGGTIELRDELFEIGKRYFIRSSWQSMPVGIRRNILTPLNPVRCRGERLWAIPVEIGEEVDMTDYYLAHLPDVIETIHMNHRSMRVWTSIDLTAKPQTQQGVDMWHLHRGRWINHTDYLQENKVAVVHQTFAEERNLSLGDSITLTLWDLNVRPTPGRGIEHFSWGLRHHDRRWQEALTEEITLEIVGIFTYRASAPAGSHAKDIWVPTSVVPEWFGVEDFPSNLTYNIVLHSTAYQEAFYEAHGEALGEFGGAGLFYQFVFMEHGADQFWETVEPIIESLWLNVLLFAGMFLLSILLIIFLYFRQHRRNVAILRALGTPSRRVTRYLLTPMLFLWFPLLLLGSYIAREFAETAAAETLTPLWEYGDYEVRTISADVTWFIGTIVVISGLILLIVFLTACRASNGRILERLQGEVSKNRKKTSRGKGQKEKQKILEILNETFVEKPSFESMEMISYLVTDLTKDVKNQQRAIWRNINRRILRTPIRTILVIAIALISVIAFGWLQTSINYNEAEIERMWNTPVVGEVHRMALDVEYHAEMEQIVSSGTVVNVFQTGFMDSVYLEVGFEFAYLVRPRPDGSFPDDVWEMWGEWGPAGLFDRRRNRLFAVTDLAELERENNEPTDIFGRPRRVSTVLADFEFDPLEIVYAQGFDPAAFDYGVVYDFDMVIPIILPADLMEELELEFGDHVFISHPWYQRRYDHPFFHPPTQPHGRPAWSLIRQWTINAEIVGMYTGIIHRPFAHNAIVIPYGIIQPIRNSLPAGRLNRIAAYSTVRFFVDPARNRETEELRELLERIVSNPWAGTVPLSFTLRDEEMIFVVQQLEQNLELLNFLYPIVLAVSLVIALGLSALILLQNVKNAAVMRILGMSKKGTRWAFLKEQTVITLVGLLLGLFIFAVIENTFLLDGRIYLFMGLYLSAMFLGSFLGAILISNRAPLDLLQVKE